MYEWLLILTMAYFHMNYLLRTASAKTKNNVLRLEWTVVNMFQDDLKALIFRNSQLWIFLFLKELIIGDK